MSDNQHSDDEGELGLFAEPEGYYQPEKEPTFAQHEMQDGRDLKLRMVGHNPLWVGQFVPLSCVVLVPFCFHRCSTAFMQIPLPPHCYHQGVL